MIELDGKEESDEGYCRRWFWDDEEYWEVEKAVEKRDCEEFADLVFPY